VAIRAVVFDIGGILEIWSGEGDPSQAYPLLFAAWEPRLGLGPGELAARMREVGERLASQGKHAMLGTCTEEEWLAELHHATGLEGPQSDAQFAAFMRDSWNAYCGQPNHELIAYFQGLRPRYQTALLSNSGVGARREEEARYHFAAMTDLILYSHEEGVVKPDPRIFELACERLGRQPAEMVFLDDCAGHVAAAHALGIHALHYQDNAQAIAEIEACLLTHTA
jgi:putative hydrolase of the HAD superfamily